MTILLEDKLYKYAQKEYNVLLSGLHGVGKTTLIEKTFQRMGWKYKIFNSATLNSYTDVTGVAMEGQTINTWTNEKVDCLIKRLPEDFAADKYDAIFFDEISRATKETMNGLFQLIQFKSINGYQLRRLKVIWAAYNPYNPDADEDEQTYHVMPLDPAFEDRFRIQIYLPYELNQTFLINKYQSLAKPFIEWWYDLPYELRLKCSPRRIDESISVFKDGFDLEDVLYHEDLQPLLPVLKEKILLSQNENHIHFFIETLNNKTIEEAQRLINIENVEIVIEAIKSKALNAQYLKAINQDVLASLLRKCEDTRLEKIIDNLMTRDNSFVLSPIAIDILKSRKQLLHSAIDNGFYDYPSFSMDKKPYAEIIKHFVESILEIMLFYRVKGQELGVKKLDIGLLPLYDELKNHQHFRDFYRSCVYLWFSWNNDVQKGIPVIGKQMEFLRVFPNELLMILGGFFMKLAVMDKEYKVFDKEVCETDEIFFKVFSDMENSKTAMGNFKFVLYGMKNDNKAITKLVNKLMDGVQTIRDVNLRINEYKWNNLEL